MDTAVVVTPRLLLLLLLLLVPIQLVMVLRFGFFFQVLLLDCDQPYRHHQSFWIVVGPSPPPPPRATIRTRWLALQLHSSAVQFGICLLVVIFSSRLGFFLFTLLTFNFFYFCFIPLPDLLFCIRFDTFSQQLEQQQQQQQQKTHSNCETRPSTIWVKLAFFAYFPRLIRDYGGPLAARQRANSWP